MERIELYVAVMAGVVLSLFLIVGEIAALRGQAARLRQRWVQHYLNARFFLIFLEVCAVAAFFLIQPFLVGFLVLMALNGFNPDFSTHVINELLEK